MKKIMFYWVLFMGLFVGMMYAAELPLICPVSGGVSAGASVGAGVSYCDLLFQDTWYCGTCWDGVSDIVYEWGGCVDPESHQDQFIYVRLNGCTCNHGELVGDVWWDCSNCTGVFDYEAFLSGEGGGGSVDSAALSMISSGTVYMLSVVGAVVAGLGVVILLALSPAFLKYAWRLITGFMR